jgi:hypothetical protein
MNQIDTLKIPTLTIKEKYGKQREILKEEKTALK